MRKELHLIFPEKEREYVDPEVELQNYSASEKIGTNDENVEVKYYTSIKDHFDSEQK